MGSPRIIYVARPNATPETELSALATVYRFILSKSSASQIGVEPAPEPDGHDDAKEAWVPPAVAYSGAVEPVLERLYGRGEVAM
jgi:hypothetical protein